MLLRNLSLLTDNAIKRHAIFAKSLSFLSLHRGIKNSSVFSCCISKADSPTKCLTILYALPKRLLTTTANKESDLMMQLSKRIEENNSKNILIYSRKSGGGIFVNLMGVLALISFIGFGYVSYYIFNSVNIIRRNNSGESTSFLTSIDYGLLSFIVLTFTG